MSTEKKELRPGFLLAAAILLFNPYISTFDILPDFVAYLCILISIRGVTELVPHFNEARTAAKKLLIVSVAKLPSYLLVSASVAGDSRLRVLYTLVTFSFTILELIWLFPLVREFFAGMDYLSDRYGINSVLATKRPHGRSYLSRARCAAYVALPAKLILALLPEFSLLFTNDGSGFITVGRDLASFHPLLTGFAVLPALGFGIYFLIDTLPFCRRLMGDRQLRALLQEVREETAPALHGAQHILRARYALWCLAGGAFCLLDIVLDGLNYLPNALGILLFGAAAIILLPLGRGYAKLVLAAACVTLPVSLAAFITRNLFFAEHSYAALGRVREADRLYSLYEFFSVGETVLFTVLAILLCLLLFRIVKQETGYEADHINHYSSHLSLHAALRCKSVLFTLLGILASIAKTVDVFLRHMTERVLQGATDGSGDLTEMTIPGYGWFWLIVFCLAGAYFVYALYYASVMNGEIEHKYSLV